MTIEGMQIDIAAGERTGIPERARTEPVRLGIEELEERITPLVVISIIGVLIGLLL